MRHYWITPPSSAACSPSVISQAWFSPTLGTSSLAFLSACPAPVTTSQLTSFLWDSAVRPSLSGDLPKLQKPSCCFWFLTYELSFPASFPCQLSLPVPARTAPSPHWFPCSPSPFTPASGSTLWRFIAQKAGKLALSKEKLVYFFQRD